MASMSCLLMAPEFITFACHAIAHFDFQGVSVIYWVSLGVASKKMLTFAVCIHVRNPTVLVR